MPINQYGTGYTVEVDGITYSRNFLTAFEQINVARLVGPSFVKLMAPGGGLRPAGAEPAAPDADLKADPEAGKEASEPPKEPPKTSIVDLAVPVLNAFAELSEEVVNSVIKTVMKGVFRPSASGQGVMPVWDSQADDFVHSPNRPPPDGFTVLQIVALSLIEEYNQGLAPRLNSMLGAGKFAETARA